MSFLPTARVVTWIGAGIAMLISIGCGPTAAPSSNMSSDLVGTRYVVRCDGDRRFGAIVGEDAVHFRLDGEVVALPRAISASGARYSDGETTFWNRGREVRIEVADGEYPSCLLQEVASDDEAARLLAGAAPADTALLERDWRLMSSGGLPAMPAGETLPTLRFGRDGALTGSTGCNRLSGSFHARDGALSFPAPSAITQRACLEPGVMEQESRLVAALNDADRYYVWGGVLTLLDDDEILARFTVEE